MSHVTTAEFSELVRQYERLVYTICYQFVHDHQTAEDLAQETFLSAYLRPTRRRIISRAPTTERWPRMKTRE